MQKECLTSLSAAMVPLIHILHGMAFLLALHWFKAQGIIALEAAATLLDTLILHITVTSYKHRSLWSRCVASVGVNPLLQLLHVMTQVNTSDLSDNSAVANVVTRADDQSLRKLHTHMQGVYEGDELPFTSAQLGVRCLVVVCKLCLPSGQPSLQPILQCSWSKWRLDTSQRQLCTILLLLECQHAVSEHVGCCTALV